MIIDATGLRVGRMCTVAAKTVLKGDSVTIVNAEQAVFTGTKEVVLAKYKQRRQRGGPHWGPFYPRMPDRFVRRIIRGMLPMETPRGREAFKRVMCFIGNPKQLETVSLDAAHISRSPAVKYVTVHEICKELGGKV